MKKKVINKIFRALEVLVIVVAICFLTKIFTLARVDGNSMNPTLNNKDILIVCALGEIEDGDVLVLTTEGKNVSAEYIVKRYYEENSTSTQVWVEGDNKNHSTDSRVLGTFDKENVIGKVLFDLTAFKVVK